MTIASTARTGARMLRPRRDYAPETADLPAMDMAPVPLSADPARHAGELFRDGARHVALDDVVDLTGVAAAADAVTALVLVRELTAFGFSVDWRVMLPDGMRLPLLLGHLHPPREVLGTPHGADIAGLWSRRFFVGKCFWRRGPGFVEVRDRRSAHQAPLIIDDPGRLGAMEALSLGAHVSAIPADILTAFTRAGLAHRVGEHAWWVPYRIRRWPSPPMSV